MLLMEQWSSEEGHISRSAWARSKPPMQDMPELVTVLVESPGGNGAYGAKTIGEQPLPRWPRPSPTPSTMRWSPYPDLPITAEKVLAALQQR